MQQTEIWSARQEVLEEVACKMVPDDVLKKVCPLKPSTISCTR